MKFLPLVALLCVGCGYHPKGALDVTTGLQGIGVDEGSLAGAWVTVAEFDAIVPAGLLGDQPGGFISHFLVTRTWSHGAYTDTFRRCSRAPFEVGGSRTLVPADTFPKLATFAAGSSADHREGTWKSEDAVELWGLQNLPDPATSDLPKRANYKQSPWSEQVLDEDSDGEAAVTQYSHGSVGGKMFVVERTVFALEGTTARARPVKLGLRVDGMVEILEGIRRGETIVIDGALTLRDGAEVELVPAPAAAPPEGQEGS